MFRIAFVLILFSSSTVLYAEDSKENCSKFNLPDFFCTNDKVKKDEALKKYIEKFQISEDEIDGIKDEKVNKQEKKEEDPLSEIKKGVRTVTDKVDEAGESEKEIRKTLNSLESLGKHDRGYKEKINPAFADKVEWAKTINEMDATITHWRELVEAAKWYNPMIGQFASSIGLDISKGISSQGDESYCGKAKLAGVCSHMSSWNIPYLSQFCSLDENLGNDIEPLWGQRIPFQKIEVVETPFTTAYLSRTIIESLISTVRARIKNFLKASLIRSYKNLNTASLKNEWGIKAPTDISSMNSYDFIQIIEKEFDATKFLLRRGDAARKGVINMDGHLVDSIFHEELKDLDIFNSFEHTDNWFIPNWLHNGSKALEYIEKDNPIREIQGHKDKIKVAQYMSEGPSNILKSKFSWVNLQNFASEMFHEAERKTCRKLRYDIKNNRLIKSTHRNDIPEELKKYLDVTDSSSLSDKCLSGGVRKFSALSEVETLYPEEASYVVAYRILRDAIRQDNARIEEEKEKEKDDEAKKRVHPLRESTKSLASDAVKGTEGLGKVRDYFQYIGNTNMDGSNNTTARAGGCRMSNPNNSNHIVPSAGGAAYASFVQDKNKKAHFNDGRSVVMHWSYLESCPPSKFGGQDIGIDCYVPFSITQMSHPLKKALQ